jgi:hypothetical protein
MGMTPYHTTCTDLEALFASQDVLTRADFEFLYLTTTAPLPRDADLFGEGGK